MKFSCCSTVLLFLLSSSGIHAFAPSPSVRASAKGSTRTSTTALNIIIDDQEDIVEKIKRILVDEPPFDPRYHQIIQQRFPGAIDNNSLEETVVTILEQRGFNARNTLLATSLCCDELARRLEYDFVRVYGKNFNLGGLAGFPFAGNTGFGAMSGHIPDNGYCFLVYGPHVGVTEDGTIGKVERDGIALVDTCCGSAVNALNYVKSIIQGDMPVTANIQSFTDFQQGAVRELILPHCRSLMEAYDDQEQMAALPFALYDSQDLLLREIVKQGVAGCKGGIALLGGVQINTGPRTPDYFRPMNFDLINTNGEIVEDMLPLLSGRGPRRALPSLMNRLN